MSSYGDEAKEDGSTLLLLECKVDQRTYSHYTSKHQCLTTIVNMYEEDKDVNKREGDGIKDFMEWLDDFYQIKMLIFDKSISRYRMKDREEIKKMFEESPDDQPNNLPNGTTPNGILQLTNGSLNDITNRGRSNMDDDDESDQEENWDE